MTTLTEAIERIQIVKEATDGLTGELASVEAFAAVNNLFESLVETYEGDDTERGRLMMVLTANATGWGAMLPILHRIFGPDSGIVDNAFSTFAGTVELLIDLHENGAGE